MKHVFILKSEGHPHSFIPIIHEVMKEYDYDIHISQYKGHVSKIMQQYHEKTRVYSVGGDGFLNQCVQAVVNTEHELVVIPYGTGNDFSRLVNHGEKDAIKILHSSLRWKAHKIDTIKMNHQYYINSGCFGIDSVIANHVHDIVKIPLVSEDKSYIVSIIEHVAGYHFNHVRMTSGGKLIYEGDVTLCAINNGHYYGGGFEITPQAAIDDGFMDVIILDKIHKINALYYVWHILKRTLNRSHHTHYYRLKRLDVETNVSCNLDGEEVKQSHYHFAVNEDSVNLVYQKD